MNILMIAPQPFFQPRGTPFSVLHRIKALSILGHHVDLLTYHIGNNVPIQNMTIHRTVTIPFIKNIEIGPSIRKIFCDFFLFFKAIKFLSRNKYDVLHTHEEAGYMAIVLKPLFQIPYIYDMHSSLPQQIKNFNRAHYKPFIKLFKWLEKLTTNNADGIITICSSLQQVVESISPDKNSLLIENVADNSIVFGDSGFIDVKKKYNIPSDKKVILYTGTFEKYQGIELLIYSGSYLFKKHDDIIFVLVGGKQDQIEKRKQLTKDYAIEERIIFTGTVHPREIDCFYKISHILASPRIEGTHSPIKIYSYLRSGKPIVATSLYTHTQVLNEKVAILADPDPLKFAGAISKLLNDEKLRNHIVFEAKKLAEEKYSYKDYLEKTERIYKNI